MIRDDYWKWLISEAIDVSLENKIISVVEAMNLEMSICSTDTTSQLEDS
jgi:hypothetical protein